MIGVKRIHGYFFVLYLLLALPLSSVSASDSIKAQQDPDGVVWYEKGADGEPLIHLYFFWSEKCPHCLQALPDVLAIDEEYDWLKLHSLQLLDNPENVQKYINMAAMFGNDARSVPTFMFCGNLLSGYDRMETTGQQLESFLQACHRFVEQENPDNSTRFTTEQNGSTSLELPFLGSVSSDQYSLPILTIFIAGMDAFNPCAFFVLLFLLSMMVHTRSRRRMALIGGIFVFFSGAIYFMFMAAWLNLFIYLGELRLITLIAGAIAVLIAMVNIKDYFWFRQGFSLSISEDEKPRLIDRIRQLLRLESTATVIAATVILAVVANSYELLCTAGFPMVYTRILTLRSLPIENYYLYLLFYNLIYILPLLTIVVIFTIKLGSRKLSQREGMILKLLSGVMMLMLGALLIVSPESLNNIVAAALIIVASIGITWLTVKLTKEKPST
ncbi:MAG: thioredoxin family protein [Gammaproteobacteria bacterium]|nr:thioredoxin family protein [Gammaproteobacteria bacterium]MBT8134949.1 thioredoxin family protein [Gammaproteobacteria bacterium]NNJ49215.1 thioredoxin family protein [Gammaproteobacteria bacterium]